MALTETDGLPNLKMVIFHGYVTNFTDGNHTLHGDVNIGWKSDIKN